MQRSVRFSKSSIPVCSWRLDVNMPPPQQLLLWHWQWMEDGNPRLMQNGRLCSGFLSAQSDSVNRSARQMLSPVWGNVLAKNLRITYWKKMICTDRVFVCVFWKAREEDGFGFPVKRMGVLYIGDILHWSSFGCSKPKPSPAIFHSGFTNQAQDWGHK